MPRKSRRIGKSKAKTRSKTEKLVVDAAEEDARERELLRIALEEIKVAVEAECAVLELETEDKVQKLMTELLKVISLMSTADKNTTIREVLELEKVANSAGDGSSNPGEDALPAMPVLAAPPPPATVRRGVGRAPVVPGTRKRRRGQTSVGAMGPPPVGGMATVKSLRRRAPVMPPSAAAGMQTPLTRRSATSVFATPFGHGITAATPATRRARRGEVVMSLNGSPLGALGSHAVIAEEEPSVSIALSGGEVLTASMPTDVAGLDAEKKKEALAKLQRLQQHVATLMKSIA